MRTSEPIARPGELPTFQQVRGALARYLHVGGIRHALIAGLLAALVAAPTAHAQEQDLAQYVDPMVGTFAPGFIFPGAAAPFGMVQNSPDTRGEFAYSGYLWSDPAIQAFSLVHLSGPGVKKGGDIPAMPVLGDVSSLDPIQLQSPYDHATEKAEPGYYSVFLAKPATKAELTASTHAAMQRYTFPPAGGPKLVIDPSRSVEGVSDNAEFRVIGDREVAGFRKGRYPVHFVARFSRPFDSSGVIGKGGWVGWDEGGEVTVSYGISFVDEDGARRNLEAEAADFDFDRMRSETRAAWNEELSRIRVSGGTVLDQRSFYTALYRSFLHPNVFTDVDGRYRGMDDQIHEAKGRIQYSNFSSWDLYKSWHQLAATVQPERYHDMLISLLADYREGGFIPRWKEQSIDASHMSGDPAIPMIAEGMCRGYLQNKDARDLYEASVALVGRRDPRLLSLGWLPDRPGTTLEYGVADFSLALMAHWLKEDGEAAGHAERSLNYRNIFDPATKWIRGRGEDGSWADPFDPTGGEQPYNTTGDGFQEGNSWQYTWLAMHDARGLYDRMGGDATALERLDTMFLLPDELQTKLTVFGIVYRFPQWAPGNEHDLEVPWMYHFAGAPWKGAAQLAEARSMYRPTIDGLPGNDDLGGLSSWHVLNALGLGGITPGAPFWALGSPAFEKAEIDTADGTFTIESPGSGPYVSGAKLDGEPLSRSFVYADELAGGAVLELPRSSTPDETWGSAAEDRPPSLTGSPLSRFGCG
jgi:putative alpha-1,2-mannosidase